MMTTVAVTMMRRIVFTQLMIRRRGREAGRGGIFRGVELKVFDDGVEQWKSRQE